MKKKDQHKKTNKKNQTCRKPRSFRKKQKNTRRESRKYYKI